MPARHSSPPFATRFAGSAWWLALPQLGGFRFIPAGVPINLRPVLKAGDFVWVRPSGISPLAIEGTPMPDKKKPTVLSTCRTAVVRSGGVIPWRYAAMASSAISRQTMIASERSVRKSDDEMAWRGKLWSLAIGSRMETKCWRCRADLNRFRILSRRRVGHRELGGESVRRTTGSGGFPMTLDSVYYPLIAIA
jgi:hypothetical protein